MGKIIFRESSGDQLQIPDIFIIPRSRTTRDKVLMRNTFRRRDRGHYSCPAIRRVTQDRQAALRIDAIGSREELPLKEMPQSVDADLG